jgi:hypothetical protein
MAPVLIFSCKEDKIGSSIVSESDETSKKVNDPRIVGEWFVFGFNDIFKITDSKMEISDGQGNDYPSGSYSIEKTSNDGGEGFVFVDGESEFFVYTIKGQEVIFDFLRVSNLRCSTSKW